MKVRELSRESDGNVKIEVTVDKEGVDKALNRIYRQVAHEVNIPGFRRGKAPKQLLVARIGQDVFNKEASEALVREGFEFAVNELSLEPLDVDVPETVLEPGKPFVFSLNVETPPDVALKRYKGVPVEKVKEVADERMIDAEIDGLREKFASLEPVDGPLKEGLFAIVDYAGSIDGKPFEGGKAEGVLVEIGGNAFLPGFEKNLEGMGKGEQKTFSLDFPEDYGHEGIRGKTAKFEVTVREIKEKILPEANDDFARELGEYETFEALRKDVEERINKQLVTFTRQAYERAVIERIVSESDITAPEKMLEKQLGQEIEDQERAFQMRFPGQEFDDFLRMKDMDRQKLGESLRPRAEARVLSELVLMAVVKAEGIEPTTDDEQAEIEEMADGMDMSASKVRKRLESQGNMQLLRRRIAMRKASELIVKEAKYTEPSETENTKE